MSALDKIAEKEWKFLVDEVRSTEESIRVISESVSKFVGFALLAIAGIYSISSLQEAQSLIVYAPYAIFGIILTMNYYFRELQAMMGKLKGLEDYSNNKIGSTWFTTESIVRVSTKKFRSITTMAAATPVNLFALLVVCQATTELLNGSDDLNAYKIVNMIIFFILVSINIFGLWDIFTIRNKVQKKFEMVFAKK